MRTRGRKVRLSTRVGALAAVVSPQVVLKVARIPVGNLNFGRTSFAYACVKVYVYVYTWRCMYVVCHIYVVCVCMCASPRRFGLLCAGMGCGSQYHRGMAPAGSPPLFSTLSRIIRVRASGIICGGIGRRGYLRARSARSPEIP